MLPEYDSYGLRKRFRFISECVRRVGADSILDIGCGAGTYLTVPLSVEFPEVRVVGVDSDRESIQYAEKAYQRLENLKFLPLEKLAPEAKFDVVIASEVLEHVDDPECFLVGLRDRLNPGGCLVLTVPNGYGPFEWASFFESLLYLSGLITLISWLRRLSKEKEVSSVSASDTLAVSPHVNFFSFGEIKKLFCGMGLGITAYQPRTFLCGFGFDKILRGRKLLRWNERVSDALWPSIASDWMFLLEPCELTERYVVKRGFYAKFRTALNRKRVGQ